MRTLSDRIDHIEQLLLKTPTPWEKAEELEPDFVPDIPFLEAPVRAAVLIALVERADRLLVVYTERSSHLRAHSGQVAFPGGKLDSADEPVHVAALREAQEEIALDVSNARILGYMPPYYTGTNYLITPVVAHVRGENSFVANPKEVYEVFEVPLSHLTEPETFLRHEVNLRGRVGSTWRVDYEGHVIWGITANLTHRFIEMTLRDEQND